MLDVQGLDVRQGAFRLRADFGVPRGRCAAVIGPSGAGKSTLLNALAGFVDLAAGSVQMDGRDVTHAAPDQRGMAMLFQDGNLFPHLTLAQNVGLGLRATLRLTEAERAQVHDALNRVGLRDFADRRPGDISGGQQSRAALARVLLQQRPLLLLDEPFAALGPALRAEMLTLTTTLARQAGASLLMITHTPEDAAQAADDLIFVADGTVVAPRPVAEALADPQGALRDYLGG